MSRTPIATTGAPAAIGPYSQAIRSGNLLFVSGQVAMDPETGEMLGGDVSAQTERVLRSLDAILTAAGVTLADVIKTTVYLADMNDFAAMNRVYGAFFTDPAPARAAVQVARLPKDALVEIDCIARVDK
ncbi:MAG: RidA family protein [Acidobacteria bacterium]|nr:RidA family protein [Acidobacteriota bacterium]MXZ72496.1 RidA family protein [Acidobacteriota bacterium]MYD70169.1 RidA family protein [Acidobacteriota bacterium]MYJ05758.1 RidA family protein [Acidobacteriota bacterium]